VRDAIATLGSTYDAVTRCEAARKSGSQSISVSHRPLV